MCFYIFGWFGEDDWGLEKLKDAGLNNSPLGTENVTVELGKLVATLLNEPPKGFVLGIDGLGLELIPNPPKLPKLSSVVFVYLFMYFKCRVKYAHYA